MAAPRIRQLTLADCSQAGEVVVVIDVLRAFSAEAIAFERGVKDIIAVGTVEEAFAWKQRDPNVLLMGEVNGYPVPGFDLWNSPTQLLSADVYGRRLVHRTTAGTQGLLGSRHARVLLATSFLVAGATAAFLARLDVPQVDIILTGKNPHRDGDEDAACADYLTAVLEGGRPDPQPYLDRIRTSDAGKRFLREDPAQGWLDELVLCSQVDRCAFAMRVWQTEDGLLVQKTSAGSVDQGRRQSP